MKSVWEENPFQPERKNDYCPQTTTSLFPGARPAPTGGKVNRPWREETGYEGVSCSEWAMRGAASRLREAGHQGGQWAGISGGCPACDKAVPTLAWPNRMGLATVPMNVEGREKNLEGASVLAFPPQREFGKACEVCRRRKFPPKERPQGSS